MEIIIKTSFCFLGIISPKTPYDDASQIRGGNDQNSNI